MEYAQMVEGLARAREAGDVYKQVRDRAAQYMLEIAVIERLAERSTWTLATTVALATGNPQWRRSHCMHVSN